MLRYNENQWEKLYWSQKVFVLKLPVYQNDSDWFNFFPSNNGEYSFW